MSYGLQVLTAGGSIRTTITETIHRLVATGSVATPGPYGSVTVSFSGMTPTEEWFILIAGDAVAAPGTNQFVISTYNWAYTEAINYSVYRR